MAKHGWTHIYEGPTTRSGLPKDVRCKIIGKRAGGKIILVEKSYNPKTHHFIVNKAQLKVIPVNERK